MRGVRGVCNLIFFFVLISCIIFPAVFADEVTNINDPVNSSELANGTFNQSEISNITTTTEPTSGPTATDTIQPDITVLPSSDEITTTIPIDSIAITIITTKPTTEPTVTETIEPEETIVMATNKLSTSVPTEITATTTEKTKPILEVPGTSQASAASVAKSANGREYAKDQVIVRYNSNRFQNAKAMNAHIASSNAKIGARVHKDFSHAGLSGMQVVTLPENISVADAIAEYQKNPDVLYAEPNYIYSMSAVTPSDPSYGIQWGLHNTGQIIGSSTGTVDADIDAPEAWDLSTGSDTVVVAVIDTGVDYTHSDLAANIWTNADEIDGDGIDNDGNGYIDDVQGWDFYNNDADPMDENAYWDSFYSTYRETYHGTHCAGIIGAVGNNGVGISGVNWNVKIMPLRFLNESGSGYTSDAIDAINYASANGAHVISNSWGGTYNSQALKDAIDSSSAVVVCAAGNNYGLNIDSTPIYPAAYSSSNIIAVAATDNQDNLAGFSNYGPISVDIAAPGVNIYSTKRGSGYQYLSGTSMATPFVSGVAALVKSVNSGLTNLQIRSAILNNVDTKSSLSGKVVTDGRLNAYKAVNSVIHDATLPTLAITSPINGQKIDTGSVTISGTAFDNVGVSSVYVRGGSVEAWQLATGTTTWSKSITLNPGSNTIYVVVYDTSRNYKVVSVMVIYDTTLPTLTILSPENGQEITDDTVTISGTAFDNVGVSSVYVRGGSVEAWQLATGTTTWSKSITLNPGSNTIYIVVYDTSRNYKVVSVTVIYNV